MKSSAIREMSFNEINRQIIDLKKTLFTLRFQHEIGQLGNPKRIYNIKKDVARLKTISSEKLKKLTKK